MLEGLTVALRSELIEAPEGLDTARIEVVIQQIVAHDQEKHRMLRLFAGYFDYPAILRALVEVG